MIKNLSSNAGDMGSIPDKEMKIPRIMGCLESPHTTKKTLLNAATKIQCRQTNRSEFLYKKRLNKDYSPHPVICGQLQLENIKWKIPEVSTS